MARYLIKKVTYEYKEIRRDICCVVESNECKSPANIEYDEEDNSRIILPECFKCGEKVCTRCSSRRKYLSYGRKRLCNNCQVEIDGNDKVVVRRLRFLNK